MPQTKVVPLRTPLFLAAQARNRNPCAPRVLPETLCRPSSPESAPVSAAPLPRPRPGRRHVFEPRSGPAAPVHPDHAVGPAPHATPQSDFANPPSCAAVACFLHRLCLPARPTALPALYAQFPRAHANPKWLCAPHHPQEDSHAPARKTPAPSSKKRGGQKMTVAVPTGSLPWIVQTCSSSNPQCSALILGHGRFIIAKVHRLFFAKTHGLKLCLVDPKQTQRLTHRFRALLPQSQ